MQSQLVNTPERAQQLLARIQETDVLVIDTETSGLDWKRNHVVGYVLTFSGFASDSFYVPLRHAGEKGSNLPGCYVPQEAESSDVNEHWFEAALNTAVRHNLGLKLVAHNFAFDLDMCYRHGIDLSRNPLECTMVTAALLNENARFYSLAQCCQRAGVQAKKGDELYVHMARQFGGEPTPKAQMQHYWRLSPEDPLAVDYACGDGTSTFQLMTKYHKGVEDQDLQVVHQLECEVTPLLHRMKREGIRINEEALEKLIVYLQERVETLSKQFGKVNLRSAKQLTPFFIEKGYENFDRTEKGNISFTEPWLETNPIGQDILKIRKLRNLLDSFAKPMKDRHIFHGRLYPNFNQLRGDENGTITGRLSSSDPNMQGTPKRNKELGKIFRKIFLPEEGHVWSSADYSQQEYRMFTHYADSPTLFQAYADGKDFHQIVAELMSVERDPTAKRLNFGILYGMGLDKLALKLGISKEQADHYRKLHREMIPEATVFMKKAQAVAESRGYVKSILGRRRRFPGGEFAHKAGNAIIQMSSADQTKLAMVRIQKFFDQCNHSQSRVLLQVHDSIECSVEPGDEEHVARIMEDHGPDSPMPLKTLIKADYKVGADYSEATYG